MDKRARGTDNSLRDECERLARRVAELEESESRRRTEEDSVRLKASRLERLAESIPHVLYRIGLPRGTCEYVNSSSLFLTGYSPEEICSDPFLAGAILLPDLAPLLRKRGKRLKPGDLPPRVEYKIIHKSGEERWLSRTAIPVPDGHGRLIAFEGVVTDITERKTAESILRADEQRFRSLVEATSDWVWEIDRNGLYTYSSPKVKDLLGYDPGEVVGRSPFDFMPPEEAERVRLSFRDILASRRPFAALENVNMRKHGRLVVLETSGVPVFDANGDFAGYRGMDRDITQRKRAEQALRESEDKFRSLVERSNVGVFLIQDRVIIYANARFAEMLGYSFEEIIDRMGPEDIVLPEDYQAFVKDNIERRLTGETESIRYEMRLLDKNGGIRNGDSYSSRTVYRGRPAVIGTVLDITERKAAEKALKEAEERLRSIFDNATVGIFRADNGGAYLHVNRAFARIFGYNSPEECLSAVTSTPSRLWVRPSEREEGIRAVYEKGSHSFEIQARNREGEVRWVSVSATVVADERGETVLDGFVQDITEAKRAEAALKESEEKYRSMFENSPLGIFQSTLDGTFLQANPALARILGYDSPYELMDCVHDIGRQIYVEPERRQKILSEMVKADDRVIFEEEYYRRDGRKWMGHLTLRAVRDGNGSLHHLDGVIEDVTEKRKMEEKLQQTMGHLRSLSRRLLDVQETERRHLARELHDEVGQTLTALRISLKRLERADIHKNAASDLSDGLNMVEGLIRQVRNLSIELRPSILDDFGLVAALEWYVNWLAPLMGFKAELRTKCMEQRLPSLLELTCFRIVQEALTNVVRHSGAKHVFVRLARQDGRLHLAVVDDGKGFDVEKTRKRALRGKTFGLLGMQERTSLAGGYLEFRSVHGKGSEIHAFFPLETGENRS